MIATCDMWHVTHDLFVGANIITKFQLPSSYEDLKEKADWLSELINDKAVYRIVPATPGLLNIVDFIHQLYKTSTLSSEGLWNKYLFLFDPCQIQHRSRGLFVTTGDHPYPYLFT